MFRRERGGTGKALALIAVSAAVVAGAGVTVVVLTTHRGHASESAQAAAAAGGTQARTVAALRVVSVTPQPGAAGVSGVAPIRLTLAAPDPGAPLPSISPAIAGSWQRDGSALVFTPSTGFGPRTRVTVTVPRPGGAWTASYTTGTYSLLRLQQLLGQLGYLPLSWAADLGATIPPEDTAAQLSAAYSPPVGVFTWHHGYPAELTSFWRPGQANLITTGAIMAFQSQHGMQPDGQVSSGLWKALLRAASQQAINPAGYTYAIASKVLPETLTIWHNGRMVFTSYANTGIPVAPTADGTYPVYLRYYFQVMQGTNPDGSRYADPVYYVSYFDGGEAVHYFPRGSYGWPQSLGCVELPWSSAAKAWPYLTYGSLVTVRPA